MIMTTRSWRPCGDWQGASEIGMSIGVDPKHCERVLQCSGVDGGSMLGMKMITKKRIGASSREPYLRG